MEKSFTLYNKEIADRAAKEGREMSIKSLSLFADVPEEVVEVFFDKCGNLPIDFYKDKNGEDLGIVESLQKLERTLKIRKVAKLSNGFNK